MKGLGTKDSPYEITTYEELIEVKEQKKYYKLINDIDCSASKNMRVKTSGTPIDYSLWAQIDLNNKSIICPVVNNESSNEALFWSLHIYNGQILDIYPISVDTSRSAYIFRNVAADYVSISVNFSIPNHLSFAYNSNFQRCNIKFTGSTDIIIINGHPGLVDCKITFDDFTVSNNNAVFDWSTNFCFITGKIKFTGDITETYRWDTGFFAFDSRNGYGSENIVDVEFSGNFENETYIVNLGKNASFTKYMVVNADSLGGKYKMAANNIVTASDLLLPSVLKSKGMQINEVK